MPCISKSHQIDAAAQAGGVRLGLIAVLSMAFASFVAFGRENFVQGPGKPCSSGRSRGRVCMVSAVTALAVFLFLYLGTFQIPVDSFNEIFGGSTVVPPNKLSTTFASF